MAKLLISKRENRPIRVNSLVRDIRERYARALAQGFSPEEATRIANEGNQGDLAPEPLASTRRFPRTKPVVVSGKSSPPKAAVGRDDVPPNWEDLPWPQLRELADRLAAKRVRSREEAHRVIESALGS